MSAGRGSADGALLHVHAVEPQKVLAEDLSLRLLGELRVPVAVDQILAELDFENALSAHCGCQIGASLP